MRELAPAAWPFAKRPLWFKSVERLDSKASERLCGRTLMAEWRANRRPDRVQLLNGKPTPKHWLQADVACRAPPEPGLSAARGPALRAVGVT